MSDFYLFFSCYQIKFFFRRRRIVKNASFLPAFFIEIVSIYFYFIFSRRVKIFVIFFFFFFLYFVPIPPGPIRLK